MLTGIHKNSNLFNSFMEDVRYLYGNNYPVKINISIRIDVVIVNDYLYGDYSEVSLFEGDFVRFELKSKKT